jgi:hypothetical protein
MQGRLEFVGIHGISALTINVECHLNTLRKHIRLRATGVYKT